ncbi:MAG: glycoside hydrolase family 65 protein [Anaerolineae bacterium]|nr:glycoside hydrolase family 65 protein [Anaerolineae bacterium]
MSGSKVVEPIYPYAEWDIIETSFNVNYNARNETIFALGNGYIGWRGTFEEGLPKGYGVEGTYLNGFYESQPIHYPEAAYAFAKNSQTMLNVTNGKVIKLFIEDEPFNMLEGTLLDYKRTLKLREGLLERELTWRSPEGREIKLITRRLICFTNKHLAAIWYQVTPLTFSGKIKIVSELDGDVTNLTAEDDPRLGSGLKGHALIIDHHAANHTGGQLRQHTGTTGFELVCAMENDLQTTNPYTSAASTSAFTSVITFEIDAAQGQPIQLTKYLAYAASNDTGQSGLALAITANHLATQAKETGFARLAQAQADFLAEFWADTDIVIKGDIALQQGIRFNMFHLLQSAGRDGKTNMSAKGLTGEGYEGHYFWDTEVYVIPFFLYNNPQITRKLIEYRYSILDKARDRAREMAHPKGALFPWRTINGEECSAYFPAGTAQYHINADVALAVKRYVMATEDNEFLVNYGAEILFETARLWASLGAYIPRKGNKFCINEVTGPDEYSALVNNNCYTNLMAKENLEYAHRIALWMQQQHADAYHALVAKIGLEASELDAWKKAADNMYVPYDADLQLYMQDDSFLDRVPWDFANTPKENYPLLIHYHPLVIYRHQVCKQADLVLALFLLGDKFTLDEKRRNYDFYEKVTTHDSSLSSCIFSIVASEIGYHDKAYAYFMNTARMDLDDYHGNVKDGVHIANMAGTWMCLVNGFAGMHAYEDVLSLKPYLPQGWDEYSFKVNFRGRLIGVTVNQSGASYQLLKGEPLTIQHYGQQVQLGVVNQITVMPIAP